jgi:diguanylate cyclase (GGDEF)-like protein/PAS domain S-box-containing protein
MIFGFSAYAVPTAVTALLMVVFGSVVLARRVSRVSIAFALMVTPIFIWMVAFTFLYSTRDAAVALQWARSAYLGVPLIAATIYHFTVEMLRIARQRRKALAAAWILGIGFSIAATFTDLLITNVQLYSWGYYPRYRPVMAVPFLLYFFGYLVGALAEFIRALPQARGVERKRIVLLISAFGVAYLGCVDYLPKFGIAVYPFGYLPILGFVIIAAITFHRYDLAAVTPSLAAPEIISTMADALFVCDVHGLIRFANRAAESILGYEENELVGLDIASLFDDDTGDISYVNMAASANASKERVFLAKNGEPVDLMLSISPILQHGEASGAVLIGRDIRERKIAEQRIRESEQRYRLLFERNAAGVCVATAEGRIEDCNETLLTMLGYQRGELIGGRLNEIYWRPTDREEMESLLSETKTLNSVEAELRRKDGTRLWVVQNLTMAAGHFHMTVVDISDRKRAEEQIEFHAYHDVLTLLPNRKLFMDRLRQNLTHCRRAGTPLAVMFIDLDGFKGVNDSLGHTAGDEVLLEMAKRLSSCVRADDTVARLGGDEFSIVLSELRRPEDAGRVAEKILSVVQRPLSINGIPVEVSASVGIALYPVDGIDPETLLRNADSAMYRAKESGRNNYQLCTDDLKRRAIERLSLETRLRKAILDENLVLHYQPQVSLDRMRVIGVEALVRWDDSEHGLIYPSSFIPLAEESRLILPIGDWVLRTACKQMKQWREEGLSVPYVAVNLSAKQFQQHDLVDRVGRVLQETGLDGSALDIEITETTAMANAEATIDVLNGLRELGVSISIDDFGTGYSSLNYLKRFPLNTVKIDRAFVRDLATSEGDAAIVSAVIGIARSLRLRVIAEGVETEDQLTFLRRRECDAAQGYYFSRPLAAEAMAEMLTENRPMQRAQPRLIV